MKNRWLGAAILTLSIIGGSQSMTAPAHAAISDDVQQIITAHAADVDGGVALQAAFASLISNAADPAATAAKAIASLGGASPVVLASLAGAIDSIALITPDALAKAIGQVVADGGTGADSLSANVISVAKYFGAGNRAAAGKGLAIAVASLKDRPDMVEVAGKIIAQVDISGLDEVKTAFSEQAAEIESASLQNPTGDNLLQKTSLLATTQSPN